MERLRAEKQNKEEIKWYDKCPFTRTTKIKFEKIAKQIIEVEIWISEEGQTSVSIGYHTKTDKGLGESFNKDAILGTEKEKEEWIAKELAQIYKYFRRWGNNI